MSGRALQFTTLGPLLGSPRAFLGVEMKGTGQPARPVVMLYLPESLANDKALLAEIKAHTASAARLQHPNVILVHGLEQLDEGWARIVEYADAETLRRLLADSVGVKFRPSPAVCAAILADACTGVHYAHEMGEVGDVKRPLLHGGLRPETLMVTHAGRTKVTGYGAQVFAPSPGKDGPRDAFVAPEQVLGGREAMSRQTDVYALGAVLYEMLSGVPPFTAEEGLLEQLILTKKPNANRLADFPELSEIALKALSKKAADRYATALEMHDAIVGCRNTPPVSPEVVARWVNAVVPPDHPDRVARQKLLADAFTTTGDFNIPPDLIAKREAWGLTPGSGTKPPPPVPNEFIPPPLPSSDTGRAFSFTPRPSPTSPSTPSTPSTAAPPTPPEVFSEPALTPSKRRIEAYRESEIAPYEPTPTERAEMAQQASRRNLFVGLLGGMAIGGIFWMWWRISHPPVIEEPRNNNPFASLLFDAGSAAPNVLANAPTPDAASSAPLAVVADGGANPVGAVAAASTTGTTPSVPTSVASDGGASTMPPWAPRVVPDAGSPATASAVDAGATPSGNFVLEVSTEPPLQITIDDKKYGIGVTTVSLPAGHHRIDAQSTTLHVYTAREIELKKDHQKEHIVVGSSELAFDVPSGAKVSVDGKSMGVAPLSPVKLYAGSHEVEIEYNGSHMEQRVSMHADVNLTLHAN
jgi:serine/threonine-protein kinase